MNLFKGNKESNSAWKMWADNPCYSDLLNIMNDIKMESVADEDRVSTADLTIQVIAENRGVRKGLDTLLRRIQDKIST